MDGTEIAVAARTLYSDNGHTCVIIDADDLAEKVESDSVRSALNAAFFSVVPRFAQLRQKRRRAAPHLITEEVMT